MKSENQFEERLCRQPLRPVPPGWREKILAQARAAAAVHQQKLAREAAAEDRAALIAGWRLLFARLPLAWASLAALWIALVGVNLLLPGSVVSVVAQTPPSARVESLAALDLSGREPEAAAGPILSVPEAAPTRETPTPVRRPHTQRRSDFELGCARSEGRLGATV